MLSNTKIRIGNLAQEINPVTGTLQEHVVNAATFSNMAEHGLRLFPIPVTEKLLADRCNMHTGSPTTVDGDVGREVTVCRAYMPNGGMMFSYKTVKVALEGMHHLQNLWLDLFGVELTIK